jgi:hypothetical protein
MQNVSEEDFIIKINEVLKAPSDAPTIGAIPDFFLPH